MNIPESFPCLGEQEYTLTLSISQLEMLSVQLAPETLNLEKYSKNLNFSELKTHHT